MRILCLDASTTTVGVAIFEYTSITDAKLIHTEFFKPPKNGDIFERLTVTRNYITSLIKTWIPDQVVLEDFILFMANKSQASTTVTLGIFNRIVGLTVFEQTGKSPVMINVVALRHTIKLGTFPKKEEIPALVATHLNIPFPYIYKPKGKNKGQIAEESFDIADAIALGLGYIMKPELGIKKPKKIKKKKKP